MQVLVFYLVFSLVFIVIYLLIFLISIFYLFILKYFTSTALSSVLKNGWRRFAMEITTTAANAGLNSENQFNASATWAILSCRQVAKKGDYLH